MIAGAEVKVEAKRSIKIKISMSQKEEVKKGSLITSKINKKRKTKDLMKTAEAKAERNKLSNPTRKALGKAAERAA